MLLNALASLGHKGIKTLRTFGRAGLMLFNALVGKPEFRKHAPLLVRQLYNVGVLSMLIIVVSGVFIGMVLGLQGYLVLTTYSAETSLGMLVALSLLRELGPVVRGRFIKQQNFRFHCQRPSNGNTLLLTAGKMYRIFPCARSSIPTFARYFTARSCASCLLRPST